MGNVFSRSKKQEYVFVHFNKKKHRIFLTPEDLNANNQVPLQQFRTKLAKLLNVPALSLTLYLLKPQKKLENMSATLQDYGIKSGADILAVQEAAPRTTASLSASQQIERILEDVNSNMGSRITRFVDAAPASAKEREDEHRILAETILAKTIELDNVEVDESEERAMRKEAIGKLQQFHKKIDEAKARADHKADEPKPAQDTANVPSNVQEIPEASESVVINQVAKPDNQAVGPSQNSQLPKPASQERLNEVPRVNVPKMAVPAVPQVPVKEVPPAEPVISQVSELVQENAQVSEPSNQIPEVYDPAKEFTHVLDAAKENPVAVKKVPPAIKPSVNEVSESFKEAPNVTRPVLPEVSKPSLPKEPVLPREPVILEASGPVPELSNPVREDFEPIPKGSKDVPEGLNPVPECSKPVPEVPIPESFEPLPESAGSLSEPVEVNNSEPETTVEKTEPKIASSKPKNKKKNNKKKNKKR